MFLSKFVSGVAVIGLIALGVGLPACSSSKAANESNPATAGIVRQGQTTDPALTEFLNTPADDWAWAGGRFTAPADQAVLPAGAPPSFDWNADPTTPPNSSDTIDPSKQNGPVFFLTFSSTTNPQVLRVFTSLTSYTPDAASWQKLVAASQPVSLSITAATFENDQLTLDGGPHDGQTITFTIQ